MSTIAEEFIQEGFEIGFQEGFKKGFEEGFQQGMRIAIRQCIVDLLEIRLGISEAKFQSRLAQIQKLDDLRLLVHRAATVDDAVQFEQALAAL